jgi:hypothetical protein
MAKSGGEGATSKWLDATLFEEESSLSKRWLLLEEAKRRENHERRSHEAEGKLFQSSFYEVDSFPRVRIIKMLLRIAGRQDFLLLVLIV